MPKDLLIERNTVRIGGKDEVELPGSAAEVVEVSGVLLIPKYGRNFVRSAVFQQIAERVVF